MTKSGSRLAIHLGDSAPPASLAKVVKGEALYVDGVRVVTTAEAARLLGLSRSRVQQINASGAFTNHMAGGLGGGNGGCRLIPYDEVMRYRQSVGKTRTELLEELRAQTILADPPVDPFRKDAKGMDSEESEPWE